MGELGGEGHGALAERVLERGGDVTMQQAALEIVELAVEESLDQLIREPEGVQGRRAEPLGGPGLDQMMLLLKLPRQLADELPIAALEQPGQDLDRERLPLDAGVPEQLVQLRVEPPEAFLDDPLDARRDRLPVHRADQLELAVRRPRQRPVLLEIAQHLEHEQGVGVGVLQERAAKLEVEAVRLEIDQRKHPFGCG